MAKSPFIKSVLAFIVIVSITACTSQRAPLTAEDLDCCGLSDAMEPAEIQEILGKPEEILLDDNPFDAGAKLVKWRYKDLLIGLGAGDNLGGVTILTSKFATRRGLRLGDSIERLRQLYGEPSGPGHGSWDYEGPEPLHVMRVTLEKDKVAKIYLGWLLD